MVITPNNLSARCERCLDCGQSVDDRALYCRHSQSVLCAASPHPPPQARVCDGWLRCGSLGAPTSGLDCRIYCCACIYDVQPCGRGVVWKGCRGVRKAYACSCTFFLVFAVSSDFSFVFLHSSSCYENYLVPTLPSHRRGACDMPHHHAIDMLGSSGECRGRRRVVVAL